ncbi:hypothetical protein [Agromyces sp. Soil535]|uniref:hypothetical protein n=1 Tax=Agromyces sp. Soil535 TaxID=1736390 RepID=UPI0007018A14|nr:hypothetical protein [Agromyces sp. Soil535]KRE28527.1 hypothetical protein ASG80_21030 [Agromyces sp. Soil535]
MTRDPDDDALRWEGDDDPTLAPGWKTVGKPVPLDAASDATDAAASAAVEGDVAASDEAGAERTTASTGATDVEAEAAAQPSSAELVLVGMLGGVYLVYAVGWLFWATSPAPELADPVAQFMFGLGRWFAVLAPALWFGAVLWLAAGRRRARMIWLLAGAVLLVPVPFLLRG